MPTYDFACSTCGTTVELIRTISERDSVKAEVCPHCSATGALERILSTPMIAKTISGPGGYGSRVPDGFRDVLRKIHSLPGANQNSSFL